MNTTRKFVALLKPVQRSMMLELVSQQICKFFVYIGGISLLFSLIGSFFVIPFLIRSYFFVFICCLIFIFIRIWILRPTEKDTVLLYNQYVNEDFAITGYEFLQKEGVMEQLVVEQAWKEMKSKQDKVLKRTKVYIFPKLLLVGIFCFSISFILHLFPTTSMETAKKKEDELKVIAKTEKELKKQADKETNQQVKKQLEKLAKEVGKKETIQETFTEIEKKLKELEMQKRKMVEKTNELESIKNAANQNDMQSISKALEERNNLALNKALTELNKQYDQLTDKQKEILNQLTGMNNQLSNEQLEQLAKQMEQWLNDENSLKEIEALQSNLAQSEQKLSQESLANGIAPPSSNNSASNSNNAGQNSTSSSNNSSNTSEQSNESKNNDTSSAKGQNNGSGSGSGNNGSASGNGTGAGQGSGTGSGKGTGGSGAGFGSGSRELLTIPNKVDGQQNQEVDTGTLGSGKQGEIQEGEGPVLKGNITPYDQVFTQYEEAYRESTSRYKLPQDLENVVKNYFTTINPNEK